MRLSLALVLLLPSFAFAQPTAEQKKATVKWVTDLQAPGGGFYLAPHDTKGETKPVPSLRATNGALRALKYLGADIPNKAKHAAFVLSCYDPKTGGFAEMGGKPDVGSTSAGVMAAMELGIPKEKFAKAMDYLKENAKTFEDVRIGAAAVEAWGVKDCPFDLKDWNEIADKDGLQPFPPDFTPEDYARGVGSHAAFSLRLGREITHSALVTQALLMGQHEDGGWGKKEEKSSDIESTYRVMRALMLLKAKPKDTKKLREFIDSHHNKDGGYATKTGDPSSITTRLSRVIDPSPHGDATKRGNKSNMSGVYYCVTVSKWLDEMEAKK